MVYFLVDENCMDFIPMLEQYGFDVTTPRDLGLHFDHQIVTYAFYKNMIIVTRDNGCANLCRKHRVDHLHIDSNTVFEKIILPYALMRKHVKGNKDDD